MITPKLSLNPFGTGQCLSTEIPSQHYYGYVSIPLEQGNVFRPIIEQEEDEFLASQSLWNRAMSFDRIIFNINLTKETVSIPLEQGNVFRQGKFDYYMEFVESQSLWNRAMSFDRSKLIIKITRNWSQSLWNRAMSFDILAWVNKAIIDGLNPFGTGQCLSTSVYSM